MAKLKKPTKMLITLFFICLLIYLLIATYGITTLATSGNLPDGFCVDDENGVSITEAGEYFFYADDLKPGDVLTRTLVLRNLEEGDPFDLYFLGERPESSGPVDWLDNLHMRITLNGNEVYAGRLRGDGKNTHTMAGNGADLLYAGIYLGEFKQGDMKTLKFVVTADVGHLSGDDFNKVSEAQIWWAFSAVKNVSVADAPKTGELVSWGLYLLLLLLLLLCAEVYVRYRKLRGNRK